MLKNTLKSLVLSTMLLLGFSSLVYADFYVIPVPISKKIKNVITVAKSGGQFTDVKTAVDSITDASATNLYLVYIAPGNYTVATAIQMKSFVTIMGSGEKATVLKGNISSSTNDSTSAIISGENNATLVNLAVVNNGGSGYSIGIYNTNVSPTIKDVTVTASGGDNNDGVFNTLSSSPTMQNVTATGSGGSDSYGVKNYSSSSPIMINVTATASGGDYNDGVFNSLSSSPTMQNVTATGSGGSSANYGVYNYASSPSMTNVTATGSGGSGANYGVHNINSSPTIQNSFLSGTTSGIYNGSASLSTVIGGGGNSATCSLCVDENGTETDAACN